MKPLRVCVVPEFPVGMMDGGLQIQALELHEALNVLGDGLSSELFQWSGAAPMADLYHFVGFPNRLHEIAGLVRLRERPYVVTLLFGSGQNRSGLWWAALKHRLKAKWVGRNYGRRAYLDAAAVIVTTDEDARSARIIHGVHPKLIHLVPHGVREEYYTATHERWTNEFGDQAFVLCVGAVQRRKNQLSLATACNCLGMPLVAIGTFLPGEADYAREFERSMVENSRFGGRWLRSLTNNDPLLHSAYAACRLFALLSSAETQPISALQAMAARKPVLLLRAEYTRSKPFRDLPMVPSLEPIALTETLQREWELQKPTILPEGFRWSQVVGRLRSIYEAACENVPSTSR